jgi:glutathione S-transferase
LLEKGIPFTEEGVKTHSQDEAVLSCSPLGKVPFLKTPHGALCESQVINVYLEAAYPDSPRLVPADPWQAAKMRELITFVELHLELVARELYAEAFFGAQVSEGTKKRVARVLPENIAAFKRLAKFGPYLAGDSFTMADCAAAPALFYANKIAALDGPYPHVAAYLKRLMKRPSFARTLKEADPYFHMFPT